jgi:hypothetical protein
MLKVNSGGQTGVDRAALDAAIFSGVSHGGWCPAGRLAEDGRIPDRYALRETPSAEYAERTEWNVRDSEGTLLLYSAPEPAGGTAYTIACARRLGKPWLHLDPYAIEGCETLRTWIASYGIRTLNVAGPRERSQPGVYEAALQFMLRFLKHCGGGDVSDD